MTNERTNTSELTPGILVPGTGMAILLIICLGALVYGNSLSNGFVSDDRYIIEIRDEPLDRATVFSILTTADALLDGQQLPYYRPLARLIYVLERRIFGHDPRGYHAVNILLHLACSTLILIVLRSLGISKFASAMTALLFCIHPVNAEAVNFISARNNILAAIFVLASVYFSHRAEQHGRRTGHVLAGLFIFLGLLCKETALMAIPVICYVRYRSSPPSSLSAIARWDMTFLFYPVLFTSGYFFLRALSIGSTLELSGIAQRLKTLFYIVPAYATTLLFPAQLMFPHEIPRDISALAVSLSFKWMLLGLAGLLLVRHRNTSITFGLLWALINFLPISNIVSIPSWGIADRYLYLPAVGIMLVASSLLDGLRSRSGNRLTVFLLLLLVIMMSVRTHIRNSDWQSDLTLNRSLAAVNPSSWYAHFEYGYASYVLGDVSTARDQFSRALNLDPDAPEATWIHYYLGAYAAEQGILTDAVQHLSKSVRMDPGNMAARYAMATVVNTAHPACNEFDDLMKRVWLSPASFHHVPEILSKRCNSRSRTQGGSTRGANVYQSVSNATPPPTNAIYRFPTGTSVYLVSSRSDPSGMQRSITAAYALSAMDRRTYAQRVIRFPLAAVTEARFTFDFKCGGNLYKMSTVEFRDAQGTPLGTIYPERENVTYYEQALPNTPMRQLSNAACREAP